MLVLIIGELAHILTLQGFTFDLTLANATYKRCTELGHGSRFTRMDPISYVNQHVDMINFRCTDNMIFAHAMDGTEAQTIVIAHIVRI